MATLTAAAWTCFMEWKDVLRISVWAIMHTKQQKNKNNGQKKGTFKFVNFPSTQADDYVAIFIVRVNV